MKIKKTVKKILSLFAHLGLKNKNFTIISNNCFGGTVYEWYNLPKQSPTVGCFFVSEDYIKFISSFTNYIQSELKLINITQSKHIAFYKSLPTYNDSLFCGVLNDEVELVFLHYSTREQIINKWNRRIKRINYENIIFKFNDQNEFESKYFDEFISLPYKNKLFFTVNPAFKGSGVYHLKDKRNLGFVNRDMVIDIYRKVKLKHYLNSLQKEDYFVMR